MENINKNNPDEFLGFYKSYFIDYWVIKYKLLMYQIKGFDRKNQKLFEIAGIIEIPHYEQKFLSMLKYDLHFMKFQIIETLFSFIFALENDDDLNLWFNLSFPPDSSERTFVAYDKISSLKDRAKIEDFLKTELKVGENTIPRWKYLFFQGVDLDEKEKDSSSMEENIITLLNHLAIIFSDRDDYSAYKHSLRCYHSSLALSIRPQGAQQFTPLGFAKNVIIYLTKKKKEDDIVISTTFKAFSIEEDSFYIDEAIKLLKNIINTRISHFFKDVMEEIYFFEESNLVFQKDYTIFNFSASKTSLNSLYVMGYNAINEKKFEIAISIFEKILQIDRNHYLTIFQLGLCNYYLKKYNKAIRYFNKYVKNSIAELWGYALYNLALCYYKKNELKNAEKRLNQFLSTRLDDDNALTNSAQYLLADILLILNQAFFDKTGKNKSNFLKRVENLLGKAEEFEYKNPDIWFKFAIIQDYMGKSEESKILYEKIIESFPDSLNTYINLARIYFNEDNLDRAEVLLKKALELNEKHPNTWNGIAMLKEKQGKEEEFREACENSLKYSINDENKKHALYNMGTYHKLRDDYSKAIEYYMKSLAIDKTFQLALQGLGQSLLDLEEYNKIIEITNDVALLEENITVLRIRALALSRNRKQEDALKIINKLFSVVQEDDETKSFLNNTIGDIYKISNDWEKAIQFYNKALVGIHYLPHVISQINEKIVECTRNNKLSFEESFPS